MKGVPKVVISKDGNISVIKITQFPKSCTWMNKKIKIEQAIFDI